MKLFVLYPVNPS